MSSVPESTETALNPINPLEEVHFLKEEVHRLNEEVSALRQEQHSVNMNSTATSARVEALEKRFAAMEQRMSHIDHVLMSMQGDVRKVQRELEKSAAAYLALTRSMGDFRIEIAQRFADQSQRLEAALATVNDSLKLLVERLQLPVIVEG